MPRYFKFAQNLLVFVIDLRDKIKCPLSPSISKGNTPSGGFISGG